MRTRLLGAVAMFGLTALPVLAQVQQVDQGTRQSVASKLELLDFTVQRLTVPADNVAFGTDLVLDGLTYDVWVEPASFRTADATATIGLDGGVTAPIPLPQPLTVRGFVKGVEGARAAGSRLGGGLHLTVVLPGVEEPVIWTIQPLYDVLPGADPSLVVVSRDDDAAPNGPWRCGVDDAAQGAIEAAEPAGSGGGTRAFEVCELACEADYEFYSVYNGSSEANTIADIDLVIARVSAVYEGQCNVTFQIPHYNIWTTSSDPYTSTDPGTRLSQFRSWWNANKGGVHRDLAHMFTGVNLDGSVIGIAYLSAVCTNNGYGCVQSRYTSGQNARGGLSAHEIGHNFSAQHCDGNGDCHIMCSGLGGCDGLGNPARFGAASATKITNYAAARPCLDQSGISFPFFEDWASTTINTDIWVSNSGGVVNSNADGEPSEPYSLNLDGTDSITTGSIDLTGVFEVPYFSFHSEHKGVEAGKTLVAEYLDINGVWQTFDTITSDGVDQSSFDFHVYPVDVFAWGPDFALRFRAQGADGTDDWYIDDIGVGDFPGNALPFYEPFANSTLNTSTTWQNISGAAVTTDATNEPSDPYSLNLDGTDSAETFNFLMANAPFPSYLSFYVEHKGVESGKQLIVEYTNDFGGYSTFETITSDGNDQTKFEFHQNALIFDAYSDGFTIRFRAVGADATDDWYIDDIRLGDEYTPPNDCIADFNDDGNVNTQDVLAFLNAWAAGDISADINGDGNVNTQDVLAFLNLWNAGC
ncbi:MAG: hypothetical protein IPJ41_18605 [Phycisphaerales bacterium]|nr:hypothetical protein [Phycisphaerales bacterium]